jgi:2-keto-4-pentenoate hydratase/2-oxohepta-3-ene-1,7-dioic acid hydratase in catechol pathway
MHHDNCHGRTEVDWEVELAVVIGKPAKNVTKERALSYVKGYTVANDVSARRWQGKAGGSQWCRAKVFDTFCPLGPRLVPAEEISDPNALNLSCTVNGEIVQSSNTSDMIFSVRRTLLHEENVLTNCRVSKNDCSGPHCFHLPHAMSDQSSYPCLPEQVAEIIAFLSEGTTLLPGTVILTGTPEGVGFTRDPPV